MLDVKALLTKILEQIKAQSVVGDYSYNSKSVNITSTSVDTYTEGASVSLSAGRYLIISSAAFPSNATEVIRRVQIYNKTSAASVYTIAEWDRYYVAHTLSWYVNLSATSTICTRVSSGVAINSVSTTILAIRLR